MDSLENKGVICTKHAYAGSDPCPGCNQKEEKQITLEEIAQNALRIINQCRAKPAGYRLKVLPLKTGKGLSQTLAQQAPTLAKMGMEIKTDREEAREDKGADMAVVVEVGPHCWTGPMIAHHEPWCKEGQVIRYMRYAGHHFQDPPDSGIWYRIINDEDVLGVYEEKAYEP